MDLQSWKYIALLGAVIVVFAIIFPKKAKHGSQLPISKIELEQMELSLGHFMENMEQQQDELVNSLSASMSQLKEDHKNKNENIIALEKKCAYLEEQIATLSHAYVALETKYQHIAQLTPSKPEASSAQAAHAVEERVATKDNPDSIHSRYAEVFELYDAGKSIEYIAKKFGKNKGEIQLIIQLAKQEEKIQNG